MPQDDPQDAQDGADENATDTPRPEEESEENGDGDDAEAFTTNPDVRFAAWATVAAFLILTTFYVLWGFLLYASRTTPPYMDAVAYVGVLFALVWTFGQGTASAVSDLLERTPISFRR